MGLGWSQLTPWGIVTVMVMLIAVGGLIPRWTFKKIVDDKDKLIEKLQTALDMRDEQFKELFGNQELTIRLLEEIKREAQSRRRRSEQV